MTQFHTVNKLLTFVLFIFLLSDIYAQERKPIPAYVGHVNDFANILQPEEVQQLEKKLLEYEDSTSTQIAVVIESSLNNRNEFDRSMDFARGWGVGDKENRNGVVLYIAMSERKIFILTADRTQGALTDGEIGFIIRDEIKPQFKAENYYIGIDNGINTIIKGLEGEFKTGKKKNQKPESNPLIMLVIIMFVLIVLSKFGGGKNGGINRGGGYLLPWMLLGGGGGSGFGGGSSGGGFGGFGGGGGFNGGGAGGSW